MDFRSKSGLDNLTEASYYFISLNSDAQNLQKQTFRGRRRPAKGRQCFASEPVSNLRGRRGEGPSGIRPRLVLQF